MVERGIRELTFLHFEKRENREYVRDLSHCQCYRCLLNVNDTWNDEERNGSDANCI